MKSIKYILMAAVCGISTACMNEGWGEPEFSTPPYGNNSITESNVISIAELINKYPNVFANPDQNAEITEGIQIKGRVTGNDLGGNLYKQFALQDATGAIIVSVNQNGMNGYLAEGQEILIDLKGLHIGGYRKQPQIGAPYNGNSIGRMSKDVWMQHFKILGNIGDINPDAISPADFTEVKGDMDANCGKLVTLKNVTFKDADGKATFAPKDGSVTLTANCANRALNEFGSTVVIRTSTYADFAAMTLPYDETGKKPRACNITGIATRYNATWQILIRKPGDIQIIE